MAGRRGGRAPEKSSRRSRNTSDPLKEADMFAVLANRTYRPLFLAQVAALADTGLSTVAHYQRRGLAGASPLPEGAGRVTLAESPRIRAVLRRAVRLQLPRRTEGRRGGKGVCSTL